MHRDSQRRLLDTVGTVLATARTELEVALEAADDYRSPLRSGAGPGCKGDHADPVLRTVLHPDPTAQLYSQGVDAVKAFERAAVNLRAWLDLMRPLDPARVERGRVSTDAGCIVCGGPAPVGHRRSGKCDACRKAWDRAGRPPLEDFRRLRAREQAAAAVRLHEHEQEAS